MNIALIGGTGIYDLDITRERKRKKIKTPYGSVEIAVGKLGANNIFFLSRHGKAHALPPHMINHRANVFALKKLDVERIIATNSVGAICRELAPGDIVVPNDFIDFSGRNATFYDREVVHVDFSNPYCSEVRSTLLKAANRTAKRVFDSAVYACTQGPRFETPAEIRMLRTLGCDIVGMTGVPEVVLAREVEICYASICTVTNFAAGIARNKLTTGEVKEVIKRNEANMRAILTDALKRIPKERKCECRQALKDARMK